MPFKHKAGPTRVYAYGAKLSKEAAGVALGEMRKARAYSNCLVRIELDRRKRYHEFLYRQVPEIKELVEVSIPAAEQTLAQAEAHLKAGRSLTSMETRTTRGVEDRPPGDQEVKDARQRLRVLRKRKRDLAKAVMATDEGEAFNQELTAEHTKAVKALRADCSAGNGRYANLYWGTRGLLEQRLDMDRKGPPPKFRRFKGDGVLAVQVQGGMTVEELRSGESTLVQVLEPLPGHPNDGQGGRIGKNPWYRARIRIGSDGKAPVWLELKTKLHRPLPEGARIKKVYLVARRVARNTEWSLQFALEKPQGWEVPHATASEGEVGIDMCWRTTPRGLRVAYAVGTDDQEEELIIPYSRLRRWEKIEDLQSIRKQRFNDMLDRIREFKAAPGATTLPEWFTDRTSHIHQWSSPARMAALFFFWEDNRFNGDQAIFDQLRSWWSKDDHLWSWESHQRQKEQRWRLQRYREFAASLARRYKVVVLEDIAWADLQRRANAEDTDVRQSVKGNMRRACPYLLQQTIAAAFADVRWEPPAWTTRDCNGCGYRCEFDPAKELWHTCEHCGSCWDQDANAARNLLWGRPTPPAASGDAAARPRQPLEDL